MFLKTRILFRTLSLLALATLAACTGGIAEYNGANAPRFAPYPPDLRPKVALVLGAGGPRGFAHIGVLKVLEENGIQADLVVGASVGAMIGAMHANGMKAAEIERAALELDVTRFIGLSSSGVKGSGNAIASYVREIVDDKPLEGLRKKLAVVAARKSDKSPMIFNIGDTGAAVRASSATPEHFAPVVIRNETYIDGDEATPVPIKAARSLGARVVIAVDVSAHLASTPPSAPYDWQVRDQDRTRRVNLEKPLADVFIHPDLGYYADVRERYRRMAIKRGEDAARAALPQIRAALLRAGL